MQTKQDLINTFYSGLKPDPTLTFSEWGEKYFQLPPGSATKGLIQFDRSPYHKFILDHLSWSSPTRKVVITKGTQLGITLVSDIVIHATIDSFPVPFLMLFPNYTLAIEHVKGRIEPGLENNPRLKGKVKDSMDKRGKSTREFKVFPGGTGKFASSETDKSYRQYSAGIVLATDVDSYPRDVGGTSKRKGEGSPLKLLKNRTDARQGKYKLYFEGTPTDKETSLIWREFEDSNKCYLFIRCPDCGAEQVIDFFHIKFEHDEDYRITTEPYLECVECQYHIEEYQKAELMRKGIYKPTAVSIDPLTIGLHLGSQYSNLGFTWHEMAQEWLTAIKAKKGGDLTSMQTFYNTRLGLPWEDQQTPSINPKELEKYREEYSKVPEKAAIITMGIDVQLDRFECTAIAYAEDNHRYFIEHKKIHGNPWVEYGKSGSPWEELEKCIQKTYLNDFENQQPILQICMDVNYCTKNSSIFIKKMQDIGIPIVAIFGGTGRVKTKDFVGKPTVNEHGVEIIELSVNIGKEITYNMLKRPDGIQMIHFLNNPCFNADFFMQLTAERPEYKTVSGKRRLVWNKKAGARNEATDTTNYSLAAFDIWGEGLEIDWAGWINWNKNGCQSTINYAKEPELSHGITV